MQPRATVFSKSLLKKYKKKKSVFYFSEGKFDVDVKNK